MSSGNQFLGYVPYVPHSSAKKCNKRCLISEKPFVRTFPVSNNYAVLARERLIAKLQPDNLPIPLRIDGFNKVQSQRQNLASSRFMPVIYGSKQQLYSHSHDKKCADKIDDVEGTTRISHIAKGRFKNHNQRIFTKSRNQVPKGHEKSMKNSNEHVSNRSDYYVDGTEQSDHEYTNEEEDIDIFSDTGSDSGGLSTSSTSSEAVRESEWPLGEETNIMPTSGQNTSYVEDDVDEITDAGSVIFIEDFDVSPESLEQFQSAVCVQSSKTHPENNETAVKTSKDLVIETNVKAENTKTIFPRKPSKFAKSTSEIYHSCDNGRITSVTLCSCEKQGCCAIPLVVVKKKDATDKQEDHTGPDKKVNAIY